MKKIAILFVSSLLVSNVFAVTATKTNVNKVQPQSLKQEVDYIKQGVSDLRNRVGNKEDYGYVISSPYVGVRATYNANDLLTNLPSVNLDTRLLEQRKEISEYLAAHKIPQHQRPYIALSGAVEAQAIARRDYTQGSKSDLNLSRTELDFEGNIAPWTTALVEMIYDDTSPLLGSRVSNSKAYVETGFITFGDLSQSPWYTTLGQLYVPFGRYYNFMVTDPMTKILGRTLERIVSLGYTDGRFYGGVYAYKGDSYTDDRSSNINSWGLNLGYATLWNNIGIKLGVSYISNLADSKGMQNTKSANFAGFKTHEKLDHFVPAVNLRGAVQYNNYSFIAEYVGAIRHFDRASDMSFNNRGARPQALDLEENYNFNFMNKMTSFAVGYGRTWDSLAVNLPKNSAFAKLGIEWFKSTIESIEFRQDWNYSKSTTANGGGGTVFSPQGARTRSTITAQVGIYF